MDKRLAAYLRTLGADPSCLDGWTIQTAQRAGVDVGFVITRGPELHMLSISERRAMSRRNIIDAIAPVLDKFGYVTTRVPVTETNHKLRLALGFVRSWSDANYSFWVATELPYQKGTTPCQSPL
jgi:hypothetical protein